MTSKIPSIVISRELLDRVRSKQRSALLLMGEHALPKGRLTLCTADVVDGRTTVHLESVLHRRLNDMPLRVLDEVGQPSLEVLLKHVQRTDSGATLQSWATYLEWSEILHDEGEVIAPGNYHLTQTQMADLLKHLRPFVEMQQAAKASSTGRIPPAQYTITPLRLAGACSAYHVIDRLRRQGPADPESK